MQPSLKEVIILTMKWSACHERGMKKKSESPTGFEPVTSRTPGGCSIHSYIQLSRIIQESPRYDSNLPVSHTAHQICQIKSSYELFCTLIWNLSHFLPKFEFSLIQSSVSGAFSHLFHHSQRLFCHYDHKS